MLIRVLKAATVFLALIFVCSSGNLPAKPAAAPQDPITWGTIKPADAEREMVRRAVKRIFAVAEPVEGWAWPPQVVMDDGDTLNANARLKHVPGGKPQPVITIYRGWMNRVVQGKEERFVEVLGHELAHVLLKHVANAALGTPLVATAITREQESAADVRGLELALKAGYSYADMMDVWKWEHKILGKYVAFEGLNADHPSDADRAANVARDDHQKRLWRSMSAFENGVYFLTAEQYSLAERCFRQVTRDFPSCYEGWANLGYARLMMYCDALDAADLTGFDVGQIVVGGFYRRADSLMSRGVDERLWFDAVGALREALRIKPDLVLPKANLAVAYLVRPAGKDVGAATELFEQVIQALRSGKPNEPLDPLTAASLMVNAGVAEMAAGHSESSRKFFEQAAGEMKKVGAGPRDLAGGAVTQALLYNRAVLMAASSEESGRRSAVEEFERYLRSGSPAQAWWAMAYGRYKKLCEQLGRTPQAAESLASRRASGLRLVAEAPVGGGATIRLMENVADVASKLGQGTAVPVVRRTNLQRIRYPDRGIELLATDQVIAILIRGKAIAIPIRAQGLGGKTIELRVGMTERELDQLLRSETDFQEPRPFTNPSVTYRFYRRLGVGVRVEEGTVVEIVVAQIPAEDRGHLGPSRLAVPPDRPAIK